MVNDKFWEVVKKYNHLMRSAIQGPDCLSICRGDCCSIRINVPKVLAEEYIKRGYADKKDFIRNDVFSFQLRFDENKGKCFLYDRKLNGCLVHDSGIKPPQCWIYPTKFSNPEHKDISCKRVSGWKIIDSRKSEEAEKLLKYYVFLSKLEAKKELNLIKNRINNALTKNHLKDLLKHTSPSEIAGFKDTWDKIVTLSAQGVSLQINKFCDKYNHNCGLEYLSCKSICDKVIEGLVEFLQQNIIRYVQTYGPNHEGEYSFIMLQR